MATNTPSDGNTSRHESDDWKLLDGDHTEWHNLENGDTKYKFNAEEHGQILLYNICKLWSGDKLIDVQIVSKDRKVSRYHGVLLAACSTICRDILARKKGQMYKGMLAPDDVESSVLDNLTNCLYRPEVFHETIGDLSSTMQFAVYFGLEELIVNSVINTAKLLKNLHQMLERRCMTYTLLKVEQRLIPCHSLVLAVASPILREDILAQYADDTPLPWDEIELVDHSSKVMEELVRFVYTAELNINSETMAALLYSSCKLRMMSVVKGACHYIKQSATPDTALSKRIVAVKAANIHEDTCCVDLVEQLEDYIVDSFPHVMVTREFRELATYDDVVKFMVKANLEDVEKRSILEALMNWYEHDKDGRLEQLSQLMTIVSIIKDQPGLVQVLAGALKESHNDIFGAIATIIVMKHQLANNERQASRDNEGDPNGQDDPPRVEARDNTDRSIDVSQDQVVTSQA